MTSTTTAPIGSATWAAAFLTAFTKAGYEHARPPVLQPAEPFLDLSGEGIRKSLYLTSDPGGEELCLRPDLTIPVARDYLVSNRAGQTAGFCYLGPVFRHRGDRPREFWQAGAESFGRTDRAAADADMLTLARDATTAVGVTDIEIRMGDVGLFVALIDALDLYPVWKRRLLKDFNRKRALAQDLEDLSLTSGNGAHEYEGVLAALAGSDRKAALALVTDLMSIAGTAHVGGRSLAEIADRFLEQATLKGGALPRDALDLIKRFLGVSGAPDDASHALRALTSEAGIDLASALDQFDQRTDVIRKNGIAISDIRFSTAFGRGLDYYTGFEFELVRKGAPLNGDAQPLMAGGRYDNLMSRLGSADPIPAVGFSVWVEAFAETSGSAA